MQWQAKKIVEALLQKEIVKRFSLIEVLRVQFVPAS